MALNARLRDYLAGRKVDYEIRRHGDAYTSQEVARASHVSGDCLAKVLTLRDETGYLMAVLPASRVLDLVRLRGATGRTGLELLPESELAGLFPDCEPGSTPPFGHLYDMPV